MDPYATHLLVLESLKPKPKKVLEFGAGLYSTQAFLEMDSVTRLVSVETEPAWRKKVSGEFSDGRWKLLDGEKIPPLDRFDLVFIDDGQDAAERLQTIDYVLSRKHPKVVVHDADYVPYLDAIRRFTADVEVHQDLRPWTAVVSAS